jgi:hypothetical protein
MNEHDKRLVEKAQKLDWTLIDENEAETAEGRYELHNIIMRKYHHDELKADML